MIIKKIDKILQNGIKYNQSIITGKETVLVMDNASIHQNKKFWEKELGWFNPIENIYIIKNYRL